MQAPVENSHITTETFSRHCQPRKSLLHAPRSMRYTFFYQWAAQYEELSGEASFWLQKVGGIALGMVK